MFGQMRFFAKLEKVAAAERVNLFEPLDAQVSFSHDAQM